jgi:multiple sugar transport system substrate-binding protein
MRARAAFFVMALLIAMTGGLLAFATAQAGETTLTFWTFLDPKKNTPREQAWTQIIQSFEKQHPGIKVRPEIFPWKEISPKLIVAATAGRGPDVTLVEVDLREKLARGKVLEPLNSYLAASDAVSLSDFYHPDTRTFDGNTYSLNLWTNGSALFYRSDLFEKAGLKPPKTVEEFVRVAKALTMDTNGDGKIDQWGFAEGIARSQPFAHRFLFPLIWAGGGSIAGEDGKATFNDPSGVRAVQFFADLIKTHKVMPPDVVNLTYDERLQGFMVGKYAMVVEGIHRYKHSQTSPVIKGKVGLAYLPSWDGKQLASTPVTGWDIGIPVASKQKDAAWKFIVHTLGHEAQLINAKLGGQVPARKSVAKDAYFQSADADEMRFIVEYLARSSREFPLTPNLGQLIDLFHLAIHEVLLNDASPKAALDRAAAKYNEGLR